MLGLVGLVGVLMTASPGLEPGSVITLPPHVGVMVSATENVRVALFLPWVLRLRAEEAAVLRPTQLVVEAGALFGAATAFTARLALRWLRAPLDWLALGGGLGIGLEVGSATRPVSSFELVARVGPGPTGYGLFTVRSEIRLDGTVAWLFAVGATYW